ncbi:MAG: DUF115 domain-containing protein [Nitrospiraceae bacterium]|nr:DUF115 domain-containing protein [Nitrospiraceae bacterium]
MLETDGFLSKNITIIKQRWPGLWNNIKGFPGQEKVDLDEEVPQPTLFLNGIHLSSGYNQVAEARLQASLVPEGCSCAWTYGIGIGKVPVVLLGRQEMERLVVVIMNPDVAMASLSFFDHTNWLSDPRVELVMAENEQDIHFPFAVIPSCLQLACDSAARLRDLVFLELATPFIQARHMSQNAEMVQRLKENIDLIRSDRDVSELFESRKGETIVVAAAGPTLSSHYKWLSAQSGNFSLIAVDAALKPLADAGILPDIVVTADPYREGIYSFFSEMSLDSFSDRILVYFPVVHRDILNLWPGPRLTTYSNSSIYKEIRRQDPKGMLFLSGSVLHPSVDLAVKIGASRVILLGADFSFPNGKSHVTGSLALRKKNKIPNPHWVLNGYDKRVPTAANLRGYLRDLERYIAQYPHIEFINGSREGARIKGTSYLEETI